MGYYQIGPRIGTGGMAEVYLGTHEAMGGFRKLVVMKRLSGWQSTDQEAIDRLLDEARIAATINHPNIVSTLDIGRERGEPYIVLEYLAGEDLRYILRDLHARKAAIPLAIACRIGGSIAAALAQAHDLVQPDGTHRCIVHRDVTPSNIIVTYGGVTKLVDFGVARVVDDVPRTKAGTIKGKFSYLAPEQLSGGAIDGRTDIFQLGIVLWEMVTMRRLFEGNTDHERINAVLNREIRRPSELDPSLPSCLDRTIMRALDRNPAGRHRDAHELELELGDALTALGASGGDHSVGTWMKTAFPERQLWRQELERRTLAEAAAEPEVEIETASPESPWSGHRFATSPTRANTTAQQPGSGSSLGGLVVESARPAPARGLGRIISLAVVAGLAGVIWWRVSDRRATEPTAAAAPVAERVAEPAAPPEPPADYEVDLRVLPADATITIDGEVTARGRFRGSFADDGTVHTVSFTAPDRATVHRRFRHAVALEIHLEPLAAAKPAAPAASRPTARTAVREPRHRRRGVHRPAAKPTPPDAGAPPRGSAPPPPPPKPAQPDDVFAPVTDNIDPFTRTESQP